MRDRFAYCFGLVSGFDAAVARRLYPVSNRAHAFLPTTTTTGTDADRGTNRHAETFITHGGYTEGGC